MAEARKTLPDLAAADLNRLRRRHARAYEAIHRIDFFPNEASIRAQAQWRDFAGAIEAMQSTGEPRAAAVGAITGAVIVLAKRSIVDVPTALLALVTVALLLKFKKLSEPVIVAGAALIGLAAYPLLHH